MSRVVAVVVTYNRKRLLVACLEALARQSHPLDRVIVVDNASTDGTEQHLRESGIAERLPVDYLRLARNGGGAEGFHYGIRAALAGEQDWLWLMDDDCEPLDDCLERLLAAAPAGDPATAVLAPVVRGDAGEVLPINRGDVRPRWFLSPLVQAPPGAHELPATPIEFSSFVGPLVKMDAVRRAGLPMREMFIRFEDVEYLGRLRRDERMWLIGGAEIVHRDPQPVAAGLTARWHEYRARIAFSDQWKRLYGVRNQLYAARRGGYATAPQAASQVLVQAVRTLLFHERPLLTLRLLVRYALDGWHGRFRNVPPGRWSELATARDPAAFIDRAAMEYDRDEAPPAERLRGERDRPSRPAGAG